MLWSFFVSFLCGDCDMLCCLNYLERIRELQFCTHIQHTTHTRRSLPAVRSLSIGPCFLSHTGQAAERSYEAWEVGREGSGWLPGSQMSKEEVSEQPVEPIRNWQGNGVITPRGNSLFAAPQGFFLVMDLIQTPKLQKRLLLMRCFCDSD